ncbi:MAG: hypothetical protein GF409_06085 [Candidatus Omnitrophica bacterium]|nr:hypothetical protein [Candidatus Omnitrophota bacterium]
MLNCSKSNKYTDRCVATSCDANYFPALMALLRSLESTNPRLPVVVFDGGLTPRQASRARRYAEVLPKKPFMEIESRGKFAYIGQTTLLKFEVEHLDYEKVLYLDADTVVLEDLDEVFSIPDGCVGVVREVNSLRNMFRIQHRDMLAENIDIDWEAPGFNAGIFLLCPSQWRGLTRNAEQLVARFGKDVFTKSKDQQLLNILFRGRLHDLPKKYNFAPFYDETGESSPAVVHYLTFCKPWHSGYPPGHRYPEFRRHVRIADHPEILLHDIKRCAKRFRRLHEA